MFSSTAINFCLSAAYTISISCKLFSREFISSSTLSESFKYSSFSCCIFSIFEFIFFNSFSKSSISLALPKIFTVFCATEPPVIAPLGFIKSPFNVTILKE